MVEGVGLCCECDMPSSSWGNVFWTDGWMDGVKGGREGRSYARKKIMKTCILLKKFSLARYE